MRLHFNKGKKITHNTANMKHAKTVRELSKSIIYASADTATLNIALFNLLRVKEIASNKIMAANSTYTAVPLGFPIPIVKSNLPYFPDGVYEIDGNANAYIPNTIESAMAE